MTEQQNMVANHAKETQELRDRIATLQMELKQSVQTTIETRMQYENELDELRAESTKLEAESVSKLMQQQQQQQHQQQHQQYNMQYHDPQAQYHHMNYGEMTHNHTITDISQQNNEHL